MLRRAVEVAAITTLVALSAGIAVVFGWGSAHAIPAIGGAAVATGLVFFRRGRSPARALLALVLAGLAAFAADAFMLHVLCHAYPDLRSFRAGPTYTALMVVLFGAVAPLDATSASSAGSARS